MRSIFGRLADRDGISDAPGHPSPDLDRAKADIQQATVVCDAAKAVFSLLRDKSKSCGTPHSAHVHLTGFAQPEIDTIMSLCAGNATKSGGKKWHQVYWTSRFASIAKVEPTSADTICSAIKKSRMSKTLLRVHLQRDGSWGLAEASASYRMQGYVKPPEQTLEQLLNVGSDPEMLLKRDKLNLAIAISRSLLHLSGSPLLQSQWSAENIYVSRAPDDGTGGGLRTKPYVVGEIFNDMPVAEPKDTSQINPYILGLGVLLWQLLFGQKIVVSDEDEEDEDEDDPNLSLFNALNRVHGNYQQLFVEKPCLDIIANCLNLSPLTQLDEQALREKIYWDVVTPLKNFLESFDQSHEPVSAVDIAVSVKIRDSTSWLDRFSHLNNDVKRTLQGGATPIRVAVLDTGCDTGYIYFAGPGAFDERLEGEGHWRDFVGGSGAPVDEDPGHHGTAMTTLLLRLLPSAEIFVARVAKDTEDLGISQKRIAEAIRYATEDWKVDIVSLSFGFPESVPCIEEAIAYAERLRGGRILFFAAANNHGRNQMEMFPAFCESVISVRGTDHAGSFVQRYNPDPWPDGQGGHHYGTISKDVPCDWTCGKLVKSGCSVATPIVVAIAALVISLVGCNTFENIRDAEQLVRTRRGMLSVFSTMSGAQGGHERHLAPWQLFKNGRGNVHLIGHALTQIPR